MKISPLATRVLIAVAALGLIAVLRYKPWQGSSNTDMAREKLTVGFLPVT